MKQQPKKRQGFWPPEQVDNFSNMATLCVLKDGEVLIWAGEDSTHVYFVAEGFIKMCHYTEDGDCINLLLHGPGEIVGAGGVLSGTARAVHGVAVGACKVWEINTETFYKLLHEYPDLGIEIAVAFSQRMRELDQQVLRVSSLSVEQRVALALADNVFPDKSSGEAVTSLQRIRMTHQTLANVVGVCRQTITETLGKFRREGILETQRGYIEILDAQKLMDKANNK